MCTVSWLRGVGRLELFTNRDEQRSRPQAEPPLHWEAAGGTRFVAPRDPSGGGTWVAINEFGLVLCLVNHYQAAEPSVDVPRSRGLVVTELAGEREPERVLERAGELPLSSLRGFRLLVLAPESEPGLFAWDGARPSTARGAQVDLPLISSSVRLPEVEVSRRQVFADLEREHGGIGPEMLAAFHASERPEPGPLAVSMSRPDACTVSHTRVVVEPGVARMTYTVGRPSEPDGDSWSSELELSLS